MQSSQLRGQHGKSATRQGGLWTTLAWVPGSVLTSVLASVPAAALGSVPGEVPASVSAVVALVPVAVPASVSAAVPAVQHRSSNGWEANPGRAAVFGRRCQAHSTPTPCNL